jgi:carboxymethylenebutenolidase
MVAPTLTTELLTIATGGSAYLAKPGGVPGIGVVVMMEAFGLNAYVKGVCERFARAGYIAIAPDFYHGEVFE